MMIGIRDVGKTGLLVIALSAGAVSVQAKESTANAVAVSYAELDLSKSAGAEVLYDRLQRAAAQVCGVHDRSSSLFYLSTADKKACYQEALSRAVAQIEAPLVKEQHPG